MKKPTWTDYLLGLAKCVSCRSTDLETKHGVVLAGKDHRILSTGCNGHCRGLKDDSVIPMTRPEKYPFCVHSEANSLANSNGPVRGATAYITGRSCLNCMQLLWQFGIKKIVQIDGYGWQRDEEEAPLKKIFLEQSGMEVENVTPDLSWLVDLVLEDPQLNLILMRKISENLEKYLPTLPTSA